MNTERLIEALAARAAPIELGGAPRVVAMAGLAGLAAALALVAAGLGFRPGAEATQHLPLLGLKLAFSLGSAVVAAVCLSRLAYPDGERRTPLALLLLPFIMIGLFGAASLLATPTEGWRAALLHRSWAECLVAIPLIAIAPFATLIVALRRFAPTDLRKAGAVAGLYAGAVAAAAYALHCTAQSPAFVALWYGGSVVACSLAGALVGSRLLRW